MSKHMKRVVFSVLISLAVLAGAYTSVLGASSGARHGQVHVTAGLTLDLNHQRTAVRKLEAHSPQQTQKPGHQCDSEGMNPNDY